MKNLFITCVALLVVMSCTESKTRQDKKSPKYDPDAVAIPLTKHKDIIGYWVGDFIADRDSKMNNLNDVKDYLSLDKTISLSIDSIKEDKIFGHTLVSGLQRSFQGTFYLSDNIYSVRVKEPGTNKYDGTFEFDIENSKLTGNWFAFEKLNISARTFSLSKRVFAYNADNKFEEYSQYINYKDKKTQKFTDDIDGEINEYTEEIYVSSTDKIFELNASSTELTKEDVENLKKVDITIIRNCIYARHGFSFKDSSLRSFFEGQEWYMPVSVDIQKDLTKIERENIKLLLQYEEIAEQNYDSFGR